MKHTISLLLAIATTSCTATAQQLPTSPTAPPAAPPAAPPQTTPQAEGRFKVKITITSPQDLKVREGDVIVIGQILADRVTDRSRLQFQRDGLIREVNRLRQVAALSPPELKPLPATDYMEEQASIREAKSKHEDAVKRREQQQRKLDVLATMDASEIPDAVIPHEQVVLKEAERVEQQMAAQVELEQGRLSTARREQAEREYAHSLELSKRAISIKETELRNQGQIADLEARLSQVEVQLSQLSAVRSPYSGRIQRIKFIGQTNNELSVELSLIVFSDGLPSQLPGSDTPGARGAETPADGSTE